MIEKLDNEDLSEMYNFAWLAKNGNFPKVQLNTDDAISILQELIELRKEKSE